MVDMPEHFGPSYRRVALDLHRRMKAGEFPVGSELPTVAALMDQYGVSSTTARAGLDMLAASALIDRGTGRSMRVRKPPRRIVRNGTKRYQREKDLVPVGGLPSDSHLAHELGLDPALTEIELLSRIDLTDDDIADAMKVDPSTPLVCYSYLLSAEGVPGRLANHYYTRELDQRVRARLPMYHTPWPGGTFYQLACLGIEIMSVEDRVRSRMPFPDEVAWLRMAEGVSLTIVRKISYDGPGGLGQVHEVADVFMPGDRTECRYVMDLRPWAVDAAGDSDSD